MSVRSSFVWFPPTVAGRGVEGCRSPGFTLVELLVSLVIISMLGSLSLAGLAAVRQRGKADKTRSTIRKLHEIIMPQYESYLDRRVPSGGGPAKIRWLMTLELPDVLDNVPANQGAADTLATVNSYVGTGVVRAYASYRQSLPTWSDADYQSSECLYMIVMRSGFEPEAMEGFRTDEIGDVDGDKAMEFLDGWGQPIAFFRWAPGFVSDTTPTHASVNSTVRTPRAFSPIQIADPTNIHDPFDTAGSEPASYALLPLIVSAGPDGEYGLKTKGKGLGSGWAFGAVPCTYDADSGSGPSSAGLQLVGEPTTWTTAAVSTDYLDNITNHDLNTR